MSGYETHDARFMRIGRDVARRADMVDTTGNLVTLRYQRDGITLWLNRCVYGQHSYIVNDHFLQCRRDGSWRRGERGPVSGMERSILDALWDEWHTAS